MTVTQPARAGEPMNKQTGALCFRYYLQVAHRVFISGSAPAAPREWNSPSGVKASWKDRGRLLHCERSIGQGSPLQIIPDRR